MSEFYERGGFQLRPPDEPPTSHMQPMKPRDAETLANEQAEKLQKYMEQINETGKCDISPQIEALVAFRAAPEDERQDHPGHDALISLQQTVGIFGAHALTAMYIEKSTPSVTQD